MQKDLNLILKTGARNDAQDLVSNYSALMIAFQLNDQLTEIKLAHLNGDLNGGHYFVSWFDISATW